MIFGIRVDDIIFVFKQGFVMITLKGNVDYSPKVCGATDKVTLYEPKSSSFSE